MKYKLADRAVLMRLSIGLPGESRKDQELTGEVKTEHGLGDDSGKWLKDIYPKVALKSIKQLDTKARDYVEAITLPWDTGTTILPGKLIADCGDRMRQFRGERDHLIESHFIARYQEWIDWAKLAHNGTFDESLYDVEEARKKFTFVVEFAPVPGSEHYSDEVASLLGVDRESVDCRVVSATREAQEELIKRILGPVKAMAAKLSDPEGIFRDTLVGNVREIVALAPKLNLGDDPVIAGIVKDIENKLSMFEPEDLRKIPNSRRFAAESAAEIAKRLEGYSL